MYAIRSYYVLNVTPDHLDRHASFAEYRDTKARLFAAQTPEDVAVVNRDDAGKIHTLLFGYVPLGGFYYQRDTSTAVEVSSMQTAQNAAAESLPWPFGFRKPFKT